MCTIENILGIIGYILYRPDELFTMGTAIVDLITFQWKGQGIQMWLLTIWVGVLPVPLNANNVVMSSYKTGTGRLCSTVVIPEHSMIFQSY